MLLVLVQNGKIEESKNLKSSNILPHGRKRKGHQIKFCTTVRTVSVVAKFMKLLKLYLLLLNCGIAKGGAA
jgi:hypothetical protein